MQNGHRSSACPGGRLDIEILSQHFVWWLVSLCSLLTKASELGLPPGTEVHGFSQKTSSYFVTQSLLALLKKRFFLPLLVWSWHTKSGMQRLSREGSADIINDCRETYKGGREPAMQTCICGMYWAHLAVLYIVDACNTVSESV